MAESPTSLLDEVRTSLARADHILVALDFESVFCRVGATGAGVTPVSLEILHEIAAAPTCSLAVFSERSVAKLKHTIGLDITYAGNHGLEIAGPLCSYVHPQAASVRDCVDCVSWDLEAVFEMVRGVSVERNGLSTTVNLNAIPAELWKWIETTVAMMIRPYEPGLRLVSARDAWQIRPNVEWNEASALKLLLGHLPRYPRVLVCAGEHWLDDDLEDLPDETTAIKIGQRIEIRGRSDGDQGQSFTRSVAQLTAPENTPAGLRRLP